jgi:hypothetical protein
MEKKSVWQFPQGPTCGHFSPVEEERPKVPHIKQGLALTDFDHGTHHARINDSLAQARYSPKESSTNSPTFSLIPIELEARDPNRGPADRNSASIGSRRLTSSNETVGIQPRLGVLQWFPRQESRQGNFFSSLYSFSDHSSNYLVDCNWSNGLVYET